MSSFTSAADPDYDPEEGLLEKFLFPPISVPGLIEDVAPIQEVPGLAVWQDSDDENIKVDMSAKLRTRRLLKKSQKEDSLIKGGEYEDRLREKFKKIYGEQEWASKKVKRAESEKETDIFDEFAFSTKSRVKVNRSTGSFSIKRLADVTIKSPITRKNAVIMSMDWNGNLLCSISKGDSNQVRIWEVNEKGKGHQLHATVKVGKDFKISLVCFVSDYQIVLAGPQRGLLVYDIRLNKEHTFICSPGGKVFKKFVSIYSDVEKKYFAVVADDGHEVLILSCKTFSVVQSIRINAYCAGVSFSTSSGVFIADVEGSVYRFDVKSGRCLQRLACDQTVGVTCMTLSRSHVILGSKTGVVDSIKLVEQEGGKGFVLPSFVGSSNSKAFDRLTTSIGSVVAVSDDLLVCSSEMKVNAVRACELESGRTVAGWPLSSEKYGAVTCLACNQKRDDLGNNMMLVAMGTKQGRIRLIRCQSK